MNEESLEKAKLRGHILFVLILVVITTALFIVEKTGVLTAHQKWEEALRDFVVSVWATYIFLRFYQLAADKETIVTVSMEASKAASELVLGRLEFVPRRVFMESQISNPEFEECFFKLLKSSSRYSFKGSTGTKIATRIRDVDDGFTGKSIRVLLLDPNDNDLLIAAAETHCKTKNVDFGPTKLQEEATRIKNDILKSLIRLHIVHRRKEVDLRFHKDFVFYRAELFEGEGLILSFTEAAKDFPGSALYDFDTKIYRAYVRNFDYIFNTAKVVFAKTIAIEQSIIDLLKNHCDETVARKLIAEVEAETKPKTK